MLQITSSNKVDFQISPVTFDLIVNIKRINYNVSRSSWLHYQVKVLAVVSRLNTNKDDGVPLDNRCFVAIGVSQDSVCDICLNAFAHIESDCMFN